MQKPSCEFCDGDGGEVIVRHEKWRVIRVAGAEGAAYRGFCRVIWNDHIKEMSDLDAADRATFMAAVFKLEAVLRESLQPEKMNVASLGNQTPHLHWHVIPRFRDDPAYPKPVWSTATPAVASLDKLDDKTIRDRTRDYQDWVLAVKRAFAIS